MPPDDMISYISKNGSRMFEIVPVVPEGEEIHTSYPAGAHPICCFYLLQSYDIYIFLLFD